MGTLRKTTETRTARRVDSRLTVAVAALALLGFAALGITSHADAARDPSASAFLEGALKPVMQTRLRQSVPGLVVTKVTCFVPTTSKVIAGKCTARFTIAKYRLKGTYRTNGKLDAQSRLTWSTTSLACTDLRGRRASCTGQSNSGNGLISAQLAETNLVAHGIAYRSASLKVKTAACTGLKTRKWLHGKFDDVYAQLKCTVKASKGGTYSLVLVMNGSGYGLSNVRKS